jgi:acetyl esterase
MRRHPRLLPGLLHIHGGRFISGSAQMNMRYGQSLAEDVGCVVVSVDYRLALEDPFPAGLEDCYSALKWSAKPLGVDPSKIALTGESASGGLTAQLPVLVRDGSMVLTYRVKCGSRRFS